MLPKNVTVKLFLFTDGLLVVRVKSKNKYSFEMIEKLNDIEIDDSKPYSYSEFLLFTKKYLN